MRLALLDTDILSEFLMQRDATIMFHVKLARALKPLIDSLSVCLSIRLPNQKACRTIDLR